MRCQRRITGVRLSDLAHKETSLGATGSEYTIQINKYHQKIINKSETFLRNKFPKSQMRWVKGDRTYSVRPACIIWTLYFTFDSFDCVVLRRRGGVGWNGGLDSWLVFCCLQFQRDQLILCCAGVMLTSTSHASALSVLSGRVCLLAENFKARQNFSYRWDRDASDLGCLYFSVSLSFFPQTDCCS